MTNNIVMAPYEKTRAFGKSKQTVTEAGIDLALDHFLVLFAYHSGEIENDKINDYDTKDPFENGRVAVYTASTRVFFEQQNLWLCYDFPRQKITQRAPLSIALIREIHAILTAGTDDERRFIVNTERPWEFKKHDYVVGNREAVLPLDEVEPALAELIDELNAFSGPDLLKAAAYCHIRFENIHPFAAGKGRVGRKLLNYWLMTHQEPLVIIFEEDRKACFAALEHYDTGEDVAPMLDFLREETVKTWVKATKRA